MSHCRCLILVSAMKSVLSNRLKYCSCRDPYFSGVVRQQLMMCQQLHTCGSSAGGAALEGCCSAAKVRALRRKLRPVLIGLLPRPDVDAVMTNAPGCSCVLPTVPSFCITGQQWRQVYSTAGTQSLLQLAAA